MKELKRLSEQMSDVKASVTMTMTATEELIKIKDLGRERRKQKRTQITNEELLQRLKEAEANIRIVQKKMITLMNRSHVSGVGAKAPIFMAVSHKIRTSGAKFFLS